MALDFRAYPIPQDQPEPNQGLQVVDRIAQLGQIYAAYKQQQAANALAKQTHDIELAKNMAEGTDFADALAAVRAGKTYTPKPWPELSIPGRQASPATAPATPPPYGPQLPQPGDQGFIGPSAAPATPPATPQATPDISTMAPHEQSIALLTPEKLTDMYRRNPKRAKQTMEQATFFANQGKAANEIDQNTPYSPEQVRAGLGAFGEEGKKAAEALIAANPTGTPRQLFSNTQSALGMAMKDQAFQGRVDFLYYNQGEQKWKELGDRANILAASGSSPVHAAALANQRADRALTVLNNPKATDQDLDTAITDLSGIFQNGAPHESSIGKQRYATIQSKINEVKTLITSMPQAASQPDVQAKIRQVIADVKNVDNQVIQRELNYLEAQYAPYIKNDKQRWETIKLQALNQIQPMDFGAPGQTGPAPAAPAAPQVGEIRRGYKFLGGNPADPKSWGKP